MDLRSDPNRRIWVIADELASLNKLPSLDMALAEGRKYGACLVLGFQNFAQIQDIYGVRATKSFSELMVSKFIFQAVDHENALHLSRFFGDRQVIESLENVSYGANEIRDGVNLSHHKKTEAIIRSSDLMDLKPLHFYARIAGVNNCLKSNFSYFNQPNCAEPFIEVDSMESTILGQRNYDFLEKVEYKEEKISKNRKLKNEDDLEKPILVSSFLKN
ncbi:MAG: hypothetical protein HEEMFOPI_01962 [Holosporales bacterium]